MALNIFHVTNGVLGRKDIVTFAKLVSMKEKLCRAHTNVLSTAHSVQLSTLNLTFWLQQVKDVIAMQAISFSNMF